MSDLNIVFAFVGLYSVVVLTATWTFLESKFR